MTREIFEKWMEEALNDLEMGKILSENQKYNGAVFHYQQAAEKALKACLYYYDEQPWGHSLLNLIKILIESGHKSFKKFLKYSKEIDRHYTTTRYPDALPNLSPKEVYDKEISDEIENKVEEIIEFVKNQFK